MKLWHTEGAGPGAEVSPQGAPARRDGKQGGEENQKWFERLSWVPSRVGVWKTREERGWGLSSCLLRVYRPQLHVLGRALSIHTSIKKPTSVLQRSSPVGPTFILSCMLPTKYGLVLSSRSCGFILWHMLRNHDIFPKACCWYWVLLILARSFKVHKDILPT